MVTRCDSCPFAQPQSQCTGSVSPWRNGDTSTTYLTHRIVASPKEAIIIADSTAASNSTSTDLRCSFEPAIGSPMHYLHGLLTTLLAFMGITKVLFRLKRNGSKFSLGAHYGFFKSLGSLGIETCAIRWFWHLAQQ